MDAIAGPSHKPPSLQALVLAYGTYDKIPLKAWQAFDAAMAEWQARARYGELNVVDRPQTRPRRAHPIR